LVLDALLLSLAFPTPPERISSMFRWRLLCSSVCLYLIPGVWVFAESLDSPADFLPLSPGTSWTYEGLIKWTASGSEVRKATMTWKMEVVEDFDYHGIYGAVLLGHPSDLTWFEEGRERGEHLIIRVGKTKFFRLDGERAEEAIRTMRNGGKLPVLRENDLFLDLPLGPGEMFGETRQLTRLDGMYCWMVEEVAEGDLANVRGHGPPGTNHSEYLVRWAGLPDHTRVWFVPGVGITRYQYGHHGTVSSVDVRLTGYHLGSEGAESTDRAKPE
jgi:hypothetical protein